MSPLSTDRLAEVPDKAPCIFAETYMTSSFRAKEIQLFKFQKALDGRLSFPETRSLFCTCTKSLGDLGKFLVLIFHAYTVFSIDLNLNKSQITKQQFFSSACTYGTPSAKKAKNQ